MKHLKLYESFNNIESTKEELYDLFINFEDEGWTVKPLFSKIVKDRNDWSGNLRSTKVRNVWGGEFIDWHEEVIMSDGDKKWKAVDCFVVKMSKIHYIENLTEESIVEHWKDLDSYLTSKIPVIKERAKRLGLELFGVHGKWLTLGKASHSDYSNEPYFGWDMLTDLISFAFVPIKIDEGLFDKVYSNMNPINDIGGKWNKESVFGMNLNIQPRVYIKRSLVDPTLEKISKLSKRWNLVYNSVDLYRVSKDHFIKFRFSDVEGDSDYGTESGPIPIDIGEEIVSDVKRELGDFAQFEHFHNRGYIHFNVSLDMIGKRIDEGLFDFFKKKKPVRELPTEILYEPKKTVRELPTEILYEPMNARESDVFLKSHDMIDFNKEELDYLSPISKYHKLEEPMNSTGVDLFFIQTMNNEFRIYKFEDEWYLIKHKEWVKRPNGIDDDVVWKYYKCDTFDGVKQFFIKQKELGKT